MTAKYASIISDIERNISGGHYRSGQKLPSIRGVMKLYGCSSGTAARAYAELEKRHAIYSIPGSGFYVVDNPAELQPGADSGTIDLSSASPDLNLFPYRDFQHCLNKAIDTYQYHLFTYGDSKGLDALRRTLASHLANDQVFAPVERIFVTSGIQQALEILARMPFPNGKKTVLVEQPGYDIYFNFMVAEGVQVRGIARRAAGLDLRELEEQFSNGDIKFFYTMSRYHNPLGTSLTAQEKKTIARLAGKYDVYIVEDDYMADLGTEQRFDPVYAYNSTSHVVYLKSFSKIIFPGLRLGAAVLPDRLAAAFHNFKSYADTSLLSQAALDVYIKNGMFERHKRSISSQYEVRMDALNKAVKRYNEAGLIETSGVRSGVYAQFKLPVAINLEILMKRLEERGISVRSGKDFYLSGFLSRDKFLRISISRAQPDQIDTGVKAIIEEVKRLY